MKSSASSQAGFAKSAIRPHQRIEQTVRMVRLQVSLHALGTELAAIERKLLPRLESDDLVFADLELNAALLAAEAAVRLDQSFGRIARFDPAIRPTGMQFGCGPYCSVSSFERRRQFSHDDVFLDADLSAGDRFALAGGAQRLPVPGRIRHAVVESHCGSTRAQVVDVHLRCETLLRSAGTVRSCVRIAGLLIELHAELRGPLKDVKELAERKIE